MPSREPIRDACAKLLHAESGPELERLVADLDRAITDFLHSTMAELVEEICMEKDTQKKLAMTAQLKQLLNEDLRRRSARAS